MNKNVLKKLLTITEEEIKILEKQKKHENINSVNVEGNTLYEDDGIIIRKSTRYMNFAEHNHNFVEISIGLIGKVSHNISGYPITVGPLDMLIMNHNVKHEIKTSNERDIALNILVKENAIKKVLELYEESDVIYKFIYDFYYTNKYTYHVNKSLRKNLEYDIDVLLENVYVNKYSKSVIKSNIVYLLAKIFEISYKSYIEDPVLTKLTSESINKYVDQNYSTASLSEFSQYINVEYYKLSKEIKEITGRNFKDIVQDKRLDVASELLQFSNLSVREISTQVGYENYSYFYKIFAQRFEMTPVEFRKVNN